MSALDPVAITGLGCISAAGTTLAAALDAMYAGQRQPAPPERFQASSQTGYPVFEVRTPKLFLSMDLARTRELALYATHQALADAQWSAEALARYRVGVCLGTNVGSAMGPIGHHSLEGPATPTDHLPSTLFIHTSPTLAIMDRWHLKGPSQTVVNACSSGTDALGLGAAWIRNDVCDLVIAGGADAMYEVTWLGFQSLMISDRTPCKPFDRHRNGLNLGEGAAMFILEAPHLWRRRGRKPRAAILGYGASADAFHLTTPAPDGAGLKAAIHEALQTAGVPPRSLAFINAHGTGTHDNDRIESQVLAEVFPGIPFLSTKGYTGHTLGAAGAIEAAFSIACLEQQQLPPSGGCQTPDETLAATPVTQITPVRGSVALSQSMAFGGNNAVVVLGIMN